MVCSNVCPALCATDEITVNVTPQPTAGFGFTISGFTVTFNNTSAGATAYTWNFGDGSTSNQTSPSHTFPGPGTYTVTLTASNGNCTDEISQVVTIASTGIAEENLIRELGIYPNPTKGMVTVSLALQKEMRVQLAVYNSVGQQLLAKDLGMMKQSIQNFDFSEWPSGSYMMQLMMDDEIGVKQLVIIR